jgi:hypothetical protein
MPQSVVNGSTPQCVIDRFNHVLDAINAGGRMTGAANPTLCAYYRQKAQDNERRIVDAILAFEQVTGKRACAENIEVVRAWRSRMDKETAEALERKQKEHS